MEKPALLIVSKNKVIVLCPLKQLIQQTMWQTSRFSMVSTTTVKIPRGRVLISGPWSTRIVVWFVKYNAMIINTYPICNMYVVIDHNGKSPGGEC
jgi:hypothetical protein